MQQSQSFTYLERGAAPPATTTPERRGPQLARIAGSIAIAIGVVVLIGWQLDIAVLKSAIPGLVSMKVNTAICFIWTGIALRLKARHVQSVWTQIANGLALGSIAIALLTICEYLFGWNLGIDELLYRDLGTLGTVAPGRMGINTAVSFCLTGAALLLINSPERRSSKQPQHQVQVDRITIAQIMTVVAGLMAVQAVVSYAYNVRFGAMAISMALHTTFTLAALCAGILGLNSDRGFMRALTTELMGGQSARRFIPAAILAPAIVGWLILRGLQANIYDTNIAISLMSISLTAIWLGQIRINAGILNRIDYARMRSVDRTRSSQERLKLALRGAKQGIWDLDVQTQYLTWDDRCNLIFGLAPDAVVTYAAAIDMVHPDDRELVVAAVDAAIRELGEFAQEYRTIAPDGLVRWVLAQGQVYCDSTGKRERMLGTMMDITDRKHAELNERFLNELTRRLRRITDADEIQWEAAKSLGEYLSVDRATWLAIDWTKRLATIDLDWHRDGLVNLSSTYALGNFLPPELQVALFTGESVAIADVANDLLVAPYRASYQQVGALAFVNTPCLSEGRWVATFNVLDRGVRNWRDDEISLMQAFVAQIWSLIEQTRSAQALRVEEERTRAAQAVVAQQLGEIEAIYRAAPIGLSFINTELKFVRINEQLAQVNGLAVSAHIGRTIREVLPEMAETIEPLYQQVIESGQPILNLEVSGITPSQPGINRHWLASYHPQKDVSGRVEGVSAVIQEITDLKRQSAALRESERKFRAIFNQTFELMGLLSLDGILLEANQTALDSISAVPSEIVGKYFWDTPWWHTEHLQQQLRDAIATAASGQFIRYEVEFPTGNGDPMITDFSLKPVFDDANRVTTIIAAAHDITERKQAEAALSEGEERFRTLADNMSQLAWMTDASGWIFWYNRRWFEYTGTTLAQMQGWGWQQVHHPEHVDRVVELFRHHLEIGEAWEDTFPLRGRDGEYRWFLSRAIPIRDAAGQVIRWFGTNTDITEQQATLLALEQAQADLRERNQELDSFVYVVAHDLKAPLRGIANLSQWIEDDLEGVISADIQQHTTLLRHRIQRMEATIDGLLDYARIGRSDDRIEPVVLTELLAETLDSIAPPSTFKIVIDVNLPTLYTKRLSLSQVFTNLISNGIRHHHRADGTISISARDRGDFYEFSVADDGPGISPAQHDKIFEIFQAVNPQNRSDSTGIGLAIVQKIIETEGGTIRLESLLGKGATFYFTWPNRSAISAF